MGTRAERDNVERLGDELAGVFEGEGIDYVPDPMVMRAAELFLLGRSGCRNDHENWRPHQEWDEVEAWDVIDRNLDGVFAFFHVLLTRDRIPLIDYEHTFPGSTLMQSLEGVAVDVHPDPQLYRTLAEDGLEQVQRMDLESLDRAMVRDVATELGTSGYEWFPHEAQFEHLAGLDDGKGRQMLATFVLGGIVFGGYAQATRSDHLLQTKRARLFTELTVPQDEAVLWGFSQEERLYRRLASMADEVEELRHADFTLPPSVVPYLIVNEKPRSPRELLQQAMNLREGSMGAAYRAWHSRLRSAWMDGRRDLDAEADVADVADEVRRRFGLDDHGPQGPQLTLSGGVAVNFGVVELGAAAEHDVRIRLPDRVRNWLVDAFRFRGHRKMLLRMSLDQATFDNIAHGLKNLWLAA
jgi:hypothetical protein